MTEQNQNQAAADAAVPQAVGTVTATQPATCPFDHSGFARRAMLKGAAAGVTGAAVIGATGFAMNKAAADAAPDSSSGGSKTGRALPFHGPRQQGVTTPAQKHLTLA